MYNLTAVKTIYIIVIRGLSNRWKGKVCYKIFFVLKVDHRFNIILVSQLRFLFFESSLPLIRQTSIFDLPDLQIHCDIYSFLSINIPLL